MTDPHEILEELHRCLYPERWKDCDPALLNDEGIYEWQVSDLETIGYILQRAEYMGHIIPTNTDDRGGQS